MKKIAILYQSQIPPKKNEIQKPLKPGGYSDSGADIANELIKNRIPVVTPALEPKTENDLDWVFPDTKEGIQYAIDKGAQVFWLNTVLYSKHPIINYFNTDIEVIGQIPDTVDIYDDKWETNQFLKKNDIPIPHGRILKKNNLNQDYSSLNYPLVLKPIRGRGSQGVGLIQNQNDLAKELDILFSSDKFGNQVYIEDYLDGNELTITVMPAGYYEIQNETKAFNEPWCLPAIMRFNHKNGIAPYNGIVAVIENSRLLKEDEQDSSEIKKLYKYCSKSASLLNVKAPIRIDCRADKNGKYYLFDINLKPNMTGPSRSHRKNQDSLSSLAARGIEWNYFDLLKNMINQKWKPDSL